MSTDTAVLVPLRSFNGGKSRLAPAVPAEDRRRLLRRMAGDVLAASGALPTAVVTADAEVTAWAGQVGALVLEESGGDLNDIVGAAVDELAKSGFERVIVAHGDLPLADDLTWLAESGMPDVVIVADRRDDGTNVLALPAAAGWRFAYGPASSSRHHAEGGRLGLSVAVVRDPLLAWDVDVADDLALPEGSHLDGLRRASKRARSTVTPNPNPQLTRSPS